VKKYIAHAAALSQGSEPRIVNTFLLIGAE
jgi:hypothetical protein